MDLAKYRTIFIEEATENFAAISSALLELEKDPSRAESIDVVFRMAHSVKGMAASLGYDSITEVAHKLEDRMQRIRAAGTVGPAEELSLLFRGLATLERMVEAVVETGEAPPADPEMVAALEEPPASAAGARSEAEPSGVEAASAAGARSEAVPSGVEATGAAGARSEAVPSGVDQPSAAGAARGKGTGEAGPGEAAAPPKKADPPPKPARGRPAALETPRPPATVRVNTSTLDRFLSTVGEVILNTSQVRTASEGARYQQGTQLSEGLDRMDRVVGELQRRALELRTTPLLRILEPLPRAARDVAERAGVKVSVEIRGAELELDRSILDRLSDPLVHILRNAVDHGIEPPAERRAAGKAETGAIVIEARREKDSIRISVRDDGAGIDLDAVRRRAVDSGLVHADLADDLTPEQVAALVFEPGLSTAGQVSEISGRGVGMDAVRTTLASLGGSVEIASERGFGTTTTLVVPITAAVQRVLMLGVGPEIVALPIAKVERIEELASEQIERSGSEAFVMLEEQLVPVLDLAQSIAQSPGEFGGRVNLVVMEVRGERVAFAAERVAGQQQIYVKPVPELLSKVRALAGLTILGDGRPMFLLDPNQLT